MTTPGIMVLTPYSGEVLLTVKTVRGHRITQIEYREWTDYPFAAVPYLAAEGWLECALGYLAIGGKVSDL